MWQISLLSYFWNCLSHPIFSNHYSDHSPPTNIDARPFTNQKITTLWWFRWWLTFFRNQVFFKINVYTFFLDLVPFTLNRLYSIVQTKPLYALGNLLKSVTLSWYLLYCGVLEPNPEYLQGMLIFFSLGPKYTWLLLTQILFFI